MYAVIDMGSNSMRLSVYTIRGGVIKPMFHRKTMASLLSYRDKKGRITEQGINKAISVLLSFKTIIENIRIRKVYVLATASFRNMQNKEETIRVIERATGFNLNIISGEQEGNYAFVGAAYNVNLDSGLMVDIGGGSTEFVFYKDRKICKTYSVQMGSLSLFSNFVSGLIPTKEELKKIKRYAEHQLASIEPGDTPTQILCGVGGTSRATCKLSNDYFDLPLANRVIEPHYIKKLMKSFYHEEDGINRILRVAPERIHTIIPGMILLNAIVKHYNCERLVISEYGVREGFLIKTVIGWKDGEE